MSDPSARAVDDRRIGVAAALDAASIVVFVAIGTRSHDVDSGFGDVFAIAAPFLIGLGAGWVAATAWRRPFAVVTGVVVWVVTVAVGMVLRNLVFDRGTAVSFVVVATLFLGACLVGWRLVAHAVSRRRPRPADAR